MFNDSWVHGHIQHSHFMARRLHIMMVHCETYSRLQLNTKVVNSKCVMYIIRAEQTDASNHCNLQGSNSSPKYICPYWRKAVQIRSKRRGSELTRSQEAAAIRKITASTCCKSEGFNLGKLISFHFNSKWLSWIGCSWARKQPRAVLWPCRTDTGALQNR